jgi:hypothetical protein
VLKEEKRHWPQKNLIFLITTINYIPGGQHKAVELHDSVRIPLRRRNSQSQQAADAEVGLLQFLLEVCKFKICTQKP